MINYSDSTPLVTNPRAPSNYLTIIQVLHLRLPTPPPPPKNYLTIIQVLHLRLPTPVGDEGCLGGVL
jgi:hypothetical protein